MRVHEHHRHALDTLLAERLEGNAHVVFGERCLDGAVGEDALGYVEPQSTWHERRRRLPQHVVEGGPLSATELEHVAKAARGQDPDDGSASLEQGVEADRCSVEEEPGTGKRLLSDGCRDDGLNAHVRSRGRGQAFADANASVLVVIEDKVGKRPTDVNFRSA